MELQKRDRGAVRTARDIEVKYDLGNIQRVVVNAAANTSAIDELKVQTMDLSESVVELQEDVAENVEDISDLQSGLDDLTMTVAEHTGGMEALEVAVRELDERKADKSELEAIQTELKSITRWTYYYTTTLSVERKIELPDCYVDGYYIDVFINGMKLEKTGYSISKGSSVYYLNLMNALDVIGTSVEIDIINCIVEEVL